MKAEDLLVTALLVPVVIVFEFAGLLLFPIVRLLDRRRRAGQVRLPSRAP